MGISYSDLSRCISPELVSGETRMEGIMIYYLLTMLLGGLLGWRLAAEGASILTLILAIAFFLSGVLFGAKSFSKFIR
jgi:hypothetical protein